VVIAAQRYDDANRGPELVTQADPIHPWFMPTLITVLSD
jgi:prophage DNA circulation protein